MLQRYFGFNGDPFGTGPDLHSLYLSNTHREALASLKYGFYSNRGFTALIASPGMGKTTLLFRFLTDIRESARTVFLFDIDTHCQPQELVSYILRDIGVTPGQSYAEVHEQLNRVLLTEARAGRRFVVIIDEAQNLSNAVLEKVRLLTNFETPRAKLMQIVLAGQPQLSEKLMQPSMVQVRQRISTVCRLDPLSSEETKAYINHRLKMAGYDGKPLFAEHALNLIAEASQGSPRTINNLCFNALSLCCALKIKQVNGSIVDEVIADLQFLPQSMSALAPASEAADEALKKAEQRKSVAWMARSWASAVIVLMVASVLVVIEVSEHVTTWSRKADRGNTLVLNTPPAPVPTSAKASLDKSNVDGLNPEIRRFEIRVELHQTLGDIALKYLGSFDQHQLHLIKALNPDLVDPDHIEPDQQIWLPALPTTFSTDKKTPSANIRSLP